jgi:hypothetical protein
MFYDPTCKPQTETKADPFTLDGLIAWLEKQPANSAYDYGCNGHCLLAQYFTMHGFKNVIMGPKSFDHSAGRDVPLPPILNDIAIGRWRMFPNNQERTFGAALERARAVLSSR